MELLPFIEREAFSCGFHTREGRTTKETLSLESYRRYLNDRLSYCAVFIKLLLVHEIFGFFATSDREIQHILVELERAL
jgi:hypothetical protein